MSDSTLARRREALIAECAQQRVEAAHAIETMRTPKGDGGTGFKMPLTIAGVVLGMIATRPGRALPMLTAGLSLFKLAKTVMSLVRRPS